MTDKDWLSLVFPILGSLIGGGALGIVFDLWKWKKTKKYEYIELQLRNLYSPILFNLNLVKKSYLHYEDIFNIFNKQYVQGLAEIKNGISIIEQYREEKIKDFDRLIKVRDNFLSQTVLYRNNIINIIKENIYLSELDDKEMFENIVFSDLRNIFEFDKEGKPLIPFETLEQMERQGDILNYNKEDHEVVEKRVAEKTKILFELKLKKNKE